jgi:hypothetical protein
MTFLRESAKAVQIFGRLGPAGLFCKASGVYRDRARTWFEVGNGPAPSRVSSVSAPITASGHPIGNSDSAEHVGAGGPGSTRRGCHGKDVGLMF